MNASLWSANAVTHAKIIVASLAAATLFAAVGITAQVSNGHQLESASLQAPEGVAAAEIPKFARDCRQIKSRTSAGCLSNHLKRDLGLRG